MSRLIPKSVGLDPRRHARPRHSPIRLHAPAKAFPRHLWHERGQAAESNTGATTQGRVGERRRGVVDLDREQAARPPQVLGRPARRRRAKAIVPGETLTLVRPCQSSDGVKNLDLRADSDSPLTAPFCTTGKLRMGTGVNAYRLAARSRIPQRHAYLEETPGTWS